MTAGIATIVGGANDDSLQVATMTTFTSLIGGTGTDTVALTSAAQNIGNADFGGFSSIDVLKLGSGSNIVDAGAAAVTAGIATIVGGANDDSLDASGATAGFYLSGGSAGNDTFVGSAQNDTIFGNGGTDSILAGTGADRIVFSTAAHLNEVATLEGGAGNDTISITTGDETVLDSYFQTDVVTVEVLEFAGNGNNSAVFATHANTAGIASLFGGAGNDSLTVSSAIYTAPAFVASSGTDVLSLSNSGVTLTAGFFANLSSVESFYTANGANDITFGNNGLLTITGGTGADDLDASAMTSAVTLMGGTGADTLTGGSGGSRQQGWGGTSTANVSNDTLTGGTGTDVFVLGDATGNAYGFDSNPAVNYRALITGFAMGTDRFQLWDSDQTGAVTVAADGGIANQMNISVGALQVYRFNYDNAADTGTLYVAGTTKVVAELTGFTGSGASLTSSHFTIV